MALGHRILGWRGVPCTAAALWRDLLGAAARGTPGWDAWRPWLETILTRGCLARRLTEPLAGATSRPAIAAVYARLQQCLELGRAFSGGPPTR